MALLFAEGYDDDSINRFENAAGVPHSFTAGRIARRAILIENYNDTSYPIPVVNLPGGPHSAVVVGFGMKPNTSTTTHYRILRFVTPGSGDDLVVRLERIDTGADVQLRRVTDAQGVQVDGTLLIGSPAWVQGEWNYVEILVNYGASSYCEIRVGGSPVASGDVDTAGGGSEGGWSSVWLYNDASSSVGRNVEFDDMYITDGQLLGDVEIHTLSPTSDSSVDWSPASGVDNFAMVADWNDPAKLVSTEQISQVDLYGLGGLTLGTGRDDILGVAAMARIDSTDETARAARIVTDDGVSRVNGTDKALEGLLLQEVWDASPFTTNAWSEAEVNGASFGFESRSA